MRIGIDARFLGPQLGGGGIGRYVENLLSELFLLQKAGQNPHQFVLFIHPEGQATLDKLGLDWPRVTVKSRWYTLAEQLEMPRVLRQAKLDFVHVPHFNVPVLSRLPLVATVHDLILLEVPEAAHATNLGPLRYSVKRAGLYFELGHLALEARAIITPSQATADSLVKFFPRAKGKTTVIYEGFDRSACTKACFAPAPRLASPQKSDPRLLYIGSSYPHKNLPRLLQATALLKNEFPTLRLQLVSRPDRWLEELRAEAKRLGLEETVEFSGFLPEADLHEAYRAADIFVFPSLLEGFGLPPLEALGHGLPVVASHARPMPEILGAAAHYFDPLNPEDLARAAGEVLRDQNLRAELQAAGYRQAEKYQWQETARETLKIYGGLAQRH